MHKRLIAPILAAALTLTSCGVSLDTSALKSHHPTRDLADGQYLSSAGLARSTVDGYLSFDLDSDAYNRGMLGILDDIGPYYDDPRLDDYRSPNRIVSEAIYRLATKSSDQSLDDIHYYRDQLAYYCGFDLLYTPHLHYEDEFTADELSILEQYGVSHCIVGHTFSHDGTLFITFDYPSGANHDELLRTVPSVLSAFDADSSCDGLFLSLNCFGQSLGNLYIGPEKLEGDPIIISVYVPGHDSDEKIDLYSSSYPCDPSAAIEAFASCAFD